MRAAGKAAKGSNVMPRKSLFGVVSLLAATIMSVADVSAAEKFTTGQRKPLPQVLLIGDSICGGYEQQVKKLFTGRAPVADPGAGEDRIDWPAFMRQHDMTFDQLPGAWSEAPHFGNAMVGSMLYRADDTIRLQVFRADVHDHRDDTWGWTAYSRPRLQIGHFSLHPVGRLTGCKWRKDLWNAELTGTITTDRGEIRIRHFAHAVDMAIVTELTPTAGEEGCRWTWHPAEARTTRGGYPSQESEIAGFAKQYGRHYAGTLKVYKANPAGRLETDGGISAWIQDLLAGGQYATARGEQVRGDTRTLIVNIANSYPASTAAKTAASDVKRFLALDRSGWVQRHRDWWHTYYPRSFVTVPDKGLESLYWQTIYRLGCTTRAGRCFVDTPGLWFQGKSWPYFTTDWNIQSAHWPVYAANRLEQGQALVDRLHDRREELIKAVRPAEWQEDSAYLPIAVAWDLIGNREGDMRYYHLVGNLPWALNNAWSQYRYSMDGAMLREKITPLLRRAVNLYLHMVQEGEDGTLRLPPTYSPETGVFADCNFDLALFKWGCRTLLKACKRLNIDDPLIPRWEAAVEHLPDYPADEYGFRLGRDESSSANHQHFSNLLMIYPLHLVNIEQKGVADVLKRSFDRARSTAGPGQRQAMVQAHAGPIGTAIGFGDEALDSLKRLQGDLYSNGLWYESPCIESTLAAANIIQNMLIQSWSDPAEEEPGPIRIFPAVPSPWKDVEFRDLRAEGAFLVSAKRSAGETRWVRIKSLAGEPCRVRPGMNGEIRIKGGREHELKPVSPGIYEINLKKGEDVLLYPGRELPLRPIDTKTLDKRPAADVVHEGKQVLYDIVKSVDHDQPDHAAPLLKDQGLKLLGNRFFTFSTVVRVRQIETSRAEAQGPDESSIHTPEEARAFREAIEKGWPGARITWAFSWLALKDQRPNYLDLKKRVVSYHKKYGDEITFIPGGYFANMYNTREQVNRDLHDGLQMVSEMVGGGYRPQSVLAGFLSAENLRFLAEEEGIHVCQGNIWSQYAVDNGDGEGSISYPYYPSREHFCKPAQSEEDLIDCVNLDGWTVDFLNARFPGARMIDEVRCGSRQGVGPIETVLRQGTELGTKEMLATTTAHFDTGFALNSFAWVTCIWELGLVEGRKIYGYNGRNGLDGLVIWLNEMRRRWPEARCITQGEFGTLWRGQFKNNDALDYRFVMRGSGVCGSEPEMEIRWFMNKDFRLALLRDWKANTPEKLIDFTRYDLAAQEPDDPKPGQFTRNWSLMNRLNQKGIRPQDKPMDIGQLNADEQTIIKQRYPELVPVKKGRTAESDLSRGYSK